MRTDPREGEHLPSGQAMGTMDSAATALHQAGDVLSFQLIQAMSDTLPHDQHYEGPGVHFQQWLRVLDPRTSEKQRRSIMSSLQEKDGVWSEADHASLIRYGEDGRFAARSSTKPVAPSSTSLATAVNPVDLSSGTAAA